MMLHEGHVQTFIEKALHQRIELIPYEEADGLPLSLSLGYSLYQMRILGQQCILASPKEETNLSDIRKQVGRIEALTGQRCVVYLYNTTYYARNKMLDEGIPFVWDQRQIYMPFLGVLLQENDARQIPRCTEISFLTQRLLLTALYDTWNGVNATSAAAMLDVSKMSITRAYDEIEALSIPVLVKEGRIRRIQMPTSRREIWQMIGPFLRDPLIREYHMEADVGGRWRSGISGLACLSMLQDNVYSTYAMTRKEIESQGIRRMPMVPDEEVPGCIVQEIGYLIPFRDGDTIDPLTIYLMMRDRTQDPRVEMALDEMLERHVW